MRITVIAAMSKLAMSSPRSRMEEGLPIRGQMGGPPADPRPNGIHSSGRCHSDAPARDPFRSSAHELCGTGTCGSRAKRGPLRSEITPVERPPHPGEHFGRGLTQPGRTWPLLSSTLHSRPCPSPGRSPAFNETTEGQESAGRRSMGMVPHTTMQMHLTTEGTEITERIPAGPQRSSRPIRDRLIPPVNCRTPELITSPTGRREGSERRDTPPHVGPMSEKELEGNELLGGPKSGIMKCGPFRPTVDVSATTGVAPRQLKICNLLISLLYKRNPRRGIRTYVKSSVYRVS